MAENDKYINTHKIADKNKIQFISQMKWNEIKNFVSSNRMRIPRMLSVEMFGIISFESMQKSRQDATSLKIAFILFEWKIQSLYVYHIYLLNRAEQSPYASAVGYSVKKGIP